MLYCQSASLSDCLSPSKLSSGGLEVFTTWYSRKMLCPGYKQGDDVRLAVNGATHCWVNLRLWRPMCELISHHENHLTCTWNQFCICPRFSRHLDSLHLLPWFSRGFPHEPLVCTLRWRSWMVTRHQAVVSLRGDRHTTLFWSLQEMCRWECVWELQ